MTLMSGDAPGPPWPRLHGSGRIEPRGVHMALFDGPGSFAVDEKERLVRERVHQARHAAARPVERTSGGGAQQLRSGVPGDAQAMGKVGRHLVLVEALQGVVEADALAKLADRFRSELAVELGLAEEHDLHELALLRLEVGEQAKRLQRLERHRLTL